MSGTELARNVQVDLKFDYIKTMTDVTISTDDVDAMGKNMEHRMVTISSERVT